MPISPKSLLFKIWRWLPLTNTLKFNLQRLFTQGFLVGVAGIIFNQENQVLLLKHSYRKEYPWGLPSGWIQRGEQPHAALAREIKEETGLSVKIDTLLWVESGRHWPRLDVVFSGVFEKGSFRPSSEVLKAKFFALDELPELMPSQARILREVQTKSTFLD